MSLSTGVDLVHLDRIRQVLARHGERFLARVYTPEEIARYGRYVPELGARFAAKEAVAKALGVGLRHITPRGIAWHEVEVLSDAWGKPVVRLSGRARALADEQGLHQWSISLTHERDLALAFVVATE